VTAAQPDCRIIFRKRQTRPSNSPLICKLPSQGSITKTATFSQRLKSHNWWQQQNPTDIISLPPCARSKRTRRSDRPNGSKSSSGKLRCTDLRHNILVTLLQCWKLKGTIVLRIVYGRKDGSVAVWTKKQSLQTFDNKVLRGMTNWVVDCEEEVHLDTGEINILLVFKRLSV
jgi:hypothetical protein